MNLLNIRWRLTDVKEVVNKEILRTAIKQLEDEFGLNEEEEQDD